MENTLPSSTIRNEYHMLMSSLQISVSKHLLDDDFTIIWANRYFYDMAGYTKEEYEQNFHGNCRLYFAQAQEDYKVITSAVTSALAAQATKYDAICQMPRKDGSKFWIHFFGTFTEETIQGVPVIYVAYTDIDEFVRARNDLEREHKKLQTTLHMEEQTIECIKKMYRCTDTMEYMDEVLRIIGTYLQAERTYLFEIYGQYMSNTYEWCKEGIAPQKAYCNHMDVALLDPWKKDFAAGKSIVIPDVDALKEENPVVYEVLMAQGIRSMVASPIIMNKEVIGYVGADNSNLAFFTNSSMLETLSYFISISIEKAQLNERLLYNSFYDELTGSYNRNKYLQDIDAISNRNVPGSLGIVYMDVNGLKDINDHYGHMYGDQVLMEGVHLMKQAFPKGDVYRLGGDEFVVLIQNIDQETFESQVVDLKHYIFLSTNCKGAIGYLWTTDGKDIDRKISEADELMYKDKMSYYRKNPNSNRYRFHNDDILQLADKTILMKEIAQGKFEVYLQPKVDFNCHIIGGEALIRYHDHKGNIVMPNEFIHSLEESRNIRYIDFFVFETVCQLLQRWQQEGKLLRPISVNFSRYTLRIPGYIDLLNEIWERYQIDKALLEIEIIENDENVDNEFLIAIIDKIKKAGFAISIDDFGVRYSNMALFINADLDTLKVDKSLMDDMNTNQRSQMLIAALVQICHNLNMCLIAEGVENQEQFALLKELGCDGVQGFFISKPIRIHEYEARFLAG